MTTSRKMSVHYSDGQLVVQVTVHRGEEHFTLIVSEGNDSPPIRKPGPRSVFLDEGQPEDAFQAIVDQWEG